MSRDTIKELRAGSLVIDLKVQRDPPTKARVNEMKDSFDLDKTGIVTVSHRKDGSYVLLDGQTRVAVLHQMDMDDWKLTCHVYDGLTLEEESHLFRILNNTKKPTAYDDFKVGITEQDAECLEVVEIIERHGLELKGYTKDGTITCITTLRKLFRRDPAGLEKALEIAVAAWGMKKEAVSSVILQGLALIYRTHGDVVEWPALITRLSKYDGGAGGVIGTARQLSSIRSAPIYRLCGAAMVASYNKGRRVKQLADL